MSLPAHSDDGGALAEDSSPACDCPARSHLDTILLQLPVPFQTLGTAHVQSGLQLAGHRGFCIYVIHVFDWDQEKAARNVIKHGVRFEEACTVFEDPNGIDGEDLAHSTEKARRLRLARSTANRVLLVAYTKRRRGYEDFTRIISARVASRKERKRHEASEN